MRNILIFLTLFLCVSLAQSQTSVRTENSSNQFDRSYAAGIDTMFTVSSTLNPNGGFLHAISFNKVVASDSLYVVVGTADTLAEIVFTASPPVLPFTVFYDCHVDSTLRIIHKKTSDYTVSFRTRY